MTSEVSYPHPDIVRVLSDIEKIHLELIDGKDFIETDVYLDGWHFRDCLFEHSAIYVKVGRFFIENPRGIRHCTFHMDGPAAAVKALIDLVAQQSQHDSPPP